MIDALIGKTGVCYVCGKEATIAAVEFTQNPAHPEPLTRGECCYHMTDRISEPTCVSQDKRGWIYAVKLPDEREAIMIFTRKGYLRGGEFHKSYQHDVILYGKIKWTFRYKDSSRTEIQERGQQNWVIPPQHHHLAEALEDTLYCEWLDGPFEKTFVPEMRKIVEEKMKE